MGGNPPVPAAIRGAPDAFVYTVIVFTLFYLFVVYYEEPNLRRRFGESYERYCATVPRWLPSFRDKDAG